MVAATLTATADLGYAFSHWIGDFNGSSNPLTIKMADNKSLTAVFAKLSADENKWTFADDKGSGWRTFSWFGNYCETSAGWIYHEDHGWLYRTGETTASIWFYDSELGWLWTNADIYPYVYRNDDTDWLYYEIESRNPRKFYRYALESWLEVF